MSQVARHLRIRGRVQGVFFRASSRDKARRVGAAGWVRNCPDGTVELWVEGDPDAVDEVEEWVRDGGPKAARVEELEASDREPEGFDTFDVRS
ncbi:MAG: acylphosphatase [Actinomycetota bacterium]|nr:acylphosphatase [Actinomycetota bacterium]